MRHKSSQKPHKSKNLNRPSPETTGCISYGRNSVEAILKYAPKRAKTLFVDETQVKSDKLQPLLHLAQKHRLEVLMVARFYLDERTESAPHQGVLLECEPKPLLSLADLRAQLKARPADAPAPFVLALDQVVDPRNFGAIVRVAAAANVDAIVIAKHGAAPLSGVTDRASAGTLAMASIVEVTNLADAILSLKDEGLWWAATAVDADAFASESKGKKTPPVQSYLTVDYNGPIGLVLGSEGEGVRPRVQEACDYWITIPMNNPEVESLNVSVATGVLLFEVLRQRAGK